MARHGPRVNPKRGTGCPRGGHRGRTCGSAAAARPPRALLRRLWSVPGVTSASGQAATPTEWLPSRDPTRPPSLDRLATMPAMTSLFSRIIPILFVSDLAAARDVYIPLGFHVTYEGPEYPDSASLGHGSVAIRSHR